MGGGCRAVLRSQGRAPIDLVGEPRSRGRRRNQSRSACAVVSRRQTVRIDELGLGLVVAAIAADPKVSAMFQEMASGEGYWVTGEPTGHARLRELHTCIRAPWRIDPTKMNDVLWKRVAQHLRRPGPISSLARRIRNDLAIRVHSHYVAIEVKGLEPLDGQVKLADFTFGTVANVVRGANAEVDVALENADGFFAIDAAKTMVISFKIELPPGDKMDGERIRQRAEEGLNLLAVSYLRRWGNTGPVWDLKTGNYSWTWKGSGSAAHMQWSRVWMRGLSYQVVPEWLEARERNPLPPELKAKGLPRFRTRLDGYTSLPRGDLREDFKAAYNALGQSARLLPTAPASVALAWAAFERAYGLDDRRKARSIANCLMLASAAKGMFQDPVDLVNLYLLRNEAVHEAAMLHWTEKQGLDRLGTVYSHVETLLEYCLAEGFSNRRQVNAAIDIPEHQAVAKKWVESARSRLVEERRLAVLPSYQERLDRGIALWDQVEDVVEPARVPPKPSRPRAGKQSV